MHQQSDLVDVHLSGTTDTIDSLFTEPLLDNDKKYTVECTEFQCSLHGETALPPPSFFKEGDVVRGEHIILQVRRRRVTVGGVAPGHASTFLTDNAGDPANNALVAQFAGLDTFIADAVPVRTLRTSSTTYSVSSTILRRCMLATGQLALVAHCTGELRTGLSKQTTISSRSSYSRTEPFDCIWLRTFASTSGVTCRISARTC